jgi:hypothetical protein
MAVSTSAQTRPVPEIAADRGFTIPSKVQTPIVLQTQPDAACDLHAEGVIDTAHTMRFYADGEGYVQLHASSKYDSPTDVRMQLDCQAGGKVTTYPLHLRTGVAPTENMPAPQTSIPTLKGARVLPALTDEDAKKLSAKDLISQGYPRRPDAVTSPKNYETWLDLVSRPITMLPPHSVSRSDISHRGRNVEAGAGSTACPAICTTSNWSGYETHAAKGTYISVSGEWSVPVIILGDPGNVTYSAFWVGLDGDATNDLVQAGTEQDYVDIGPLSMASYHVWTEVVPNQLTEQDVNLSVSPGDDVFVQVFVEGGTCTFLIVDKTTGKALNTTTPLGNTQFAGSEAEWIMERPQVGGTLPNLSQYILSVMTNAYAFTGKSAPVPSANANVQITMDNKFVNYPDNNTLPFPVQAPPDTIIFTWANFH